MNRALRTKFLKVFTNLPIPERRNTIAIIDEQPLSWFVCWLEIDQMTKKGQEILEYLDELKLI